MLPDRVSNPGPLTYESGALPIALRGPACLTRIIYRFKQCNWHHLDAAADPTGQCHRL